MHHMGVYTNIRQTEGLRTTGIEKQLKLNTTLLLYSQREAQGSKNGTLQTFLCCKRAHWYLMGLLDLEEMR